MNHVKFKYSRLRMGFAYALFGAFVLSLPMLPNVAGALSFDLPPPDEAIIGATQIIKTRYQDTFIELARQYDVGYAELKLANPTVDPWLPGEGTEVVIPTQFLLPDAPREGVVLNVTEMRMYFYPKPGPGERARVFTFPVGVGRVDWETPLGETTVVRKVAGPSWYPPESIKKEHAAEGDILPDVVPPGPENPLGAHALYLGLQGYLLHGTDKPKGIGMQVTHGCVRLLPEDVATLFELAPVGTKVRIIDEPYKIAWHKGNLYMEAHPPLEASESDDEVEVKTEERFKPSSLMQSLTSAIGTRGFEQIDWLAAESMAQGTNGLPQGIPALVADETVVVNGAEKIVAEEAASPNLTIETQGTHEAIVDEQVINAPTAEGEEGIQAEVVKKEPTGRASRKAKK